MPYACPFLLSFYLDALNRYQSIILKASQVQLHKIFCYFLKRKKLVVFQYNE